MEESLPFLFPPEMGGGSFGLVFPGASHSYRSEALLPLPFGSQYNVIYLHNLSLKVRWKRNKRGPKSSRNGNMEEGFFFKSS